VDLPRELGREVDTIGSDVEWRTGANPPRSDDLRMEESIQEEVGRLLSEPVTEEAAVRIALLNNRRLRVLYEEVGVRRAQLEQAGLLPNPALSANVKFFSSGTEVEIGLVQSLVDVLWIPLRERVAKTRLEEARASLGRSLVGLIFEVRRTHLDALRSRREMDLDRNLVDVAEAALGLTLQLHDAGNTTDLELARARARAARARLDLAEAEAMQNEERESLNVLLGLFGSATAWTLTPVLPPLPAGDDLEADVESRAISMSFDLREARARVDAAAQEADLGSWETLLPDLDLGIDAKKEAGSGWGLGPAGAIVLPIFDSGQARKVGDEAKVRQALAHYWATAVEIRSAARRLRDRHRSLASRADYLREIHGPLRTGVVRETVRNYNAMQIGAFEVLAVRREELDAERETLLAQSEALRARLDLQEILAGRLDPAHLMTRRMNREDERSPADTSGEAAH